MQSNKKHQLHHHNSISALAAHKLCSVWHTMYPHFFFFSSVRLHSLNSSNRSINMVGACTSFSMTGELWSGPSAIVLIDSSYNDDDHHWKMTLSARWSDADMQSDTQIWLFRVPPCLLQRTHLEMNIIFEIGKIIIIISLSSCLSEEWASMIDRPFEQNADTLNPLKKDFICCCCWLKQWLARVRVC